MFLGSYRFDGDPADLMPGYRRVMAATPADNIHFHVCTSDAGGITVIDACPTQEIFEEFSTDPGLLGLFASCGLPTPTVAHFGQVEHTQVDHEQDDHQRGRPVPENAPEGEHPRDATRRAGPEWHLDRGSRPGQPRQRDGDLLARAVAAQRLLGPAQTGHLVQADMYRDLFRCTHRGRVPLTRGPDMRSEA